jgi:hypothetical protein
MCQPNKIGLLLFGFLLAPLQDSDLHAQAHRISGPAPSTIKGSVLLRPQHGAERLSFPATQRRAANWKSAIIVGALAGVVFGLTVASQDGDEGSDRPFSDRLSDGVVAGAMLAVPVTVIFAMLSGD